MKKNVKSVFKMLAFVLMVNVANAQTTPATATWSLLTDQSSAVTGSITATSQTLGSYLVGTQYNSTFGTITGWQRVGTTSFLPIGYTANCYVEYTITPSGGKHFTATALELGTLGGGTGLAKLAVLWSVDNFTTSQTVGLCTYNSLTTAGSVDDPVALLNTSTTPLSGQQLLTIPTFITVLPTQTLTVRMYPFITGTGNRYFASQSVKLTGVTSTASLPLSLTNLSASLQNGNAKLLWQTSNETNMKNFEVEKSTDGKVFTSIATVSATNNTANSYSYQDNAKIDAVVYYRLKMVNKDGSFINSYVVTINSKVKNGVSVYPNPVSNSVTVNHGKLIGKSSISIVNVDGKILQTVTVSTNATQTAFDLGHLSTGVYLLQVVDEKGMQTFKFIKQ